MFLQLLAVVLKNKPDEIVSVHKDPISFLHLKNDRKFEKKSFDILSKRE